MKNLLKQKDRENLIQRLQSFHPNSRKNWGKMSAHEVVPHLTDPLRLAIGEKTVPHQNSIYYNSLFGRLIVHYLPWPKGAPTAAEFLPGKGCTEPTTFEADRKLLLEAIHRFASHGSQSDFEANPVFGKLSRQAWGRLMWRHIDHHLRQFSA